MTDILINIGMSMLNIKLAGVSLAIWVAGVAGILVALGGVVSALLAIALIIPGEQPDKFLEKVSGWINKAIKFVNRFSRKKKVE